MDVTTFAELAVGQVFAAGPIIVDAARIVSFGAEFDPQAQHLGAEAAAGTAFGGLAASGWHTAAVTMRLLVDGAGPGFAHGAVGLGVDEMRWVRPVRPGDALSARSEILSLRPSRSRPGQGVVIFRTVTSNQAGEAVMTMVSSALLGRRLEGG